MTGPTKSNYQESPKNSQKNTSTGRLCRRSGGRGSRGRGKGRIKAIAVQHPWRSHLGRKRNRDVSLDGPASSDFNSDRRCPIHHNTAEEPGDSVAVLSGRTPTMPA